MFAHHVCSCWSELLTVPDRTLVVGYMHTPCLTLHCLQSVIPDTVSKHSDLGDSGPLESMEVGQPPYQLFQ